MWTPRFLIRQTRNEISQGNAPISPVRLKVKIAPCFGCNVKSPDRCSQNKALQTHGQWLRRVVLSVPEVRGLWGVTLQRALALVEAQKKHHSVPTKECHGVHHCAISATYLVCCKRRVRLSELFSCNKHDTVSALL